MQSAAQIAYTFKMDPLDVLKSSYFDYAVRLAASNLVSRWKEEAAEKAKAKK